MDKKHVDKILPVVLLALVFSAVFLGSLIYKKSAPFNQEPNISVKIDPDSFSADEKQLLVPPGPNASKEEIDAHSKLAAKLAVIGKEVEVKDCKPNPIVLQNKITSPTTFKNSGDSNLSIVFDNENVLDIKAGQSISTTKVFVHGLGLYGYLCKVGDFTGLVGYVLVAP